MDCPRCGTPSDGPECARCGVLLAKARPLRPRPAPPERHPPSWRPLVLPGVGLLALVVAAVLVLRADPPASPQAGSLQATRDGGLPSHEDEPGGRVAGREAEAEPAPAQAFDPPAELPPPALPAPPPLPPENPLAARHAALRRAFDDSDWPAVESLSRELRAGAPSDPGLLRALAYALLRQDRSSEAEELLLACSEGQGDAGCRELLALVRRSRGSEGDAEARRLSHFNVRYDGDAHEDVGREVLRVLERHYATLVRTFDHQPAQAIPVTLLTRESYYDATGAPAWSGGQYDSFDGRVRIPIGGLTASLTPELDATVLHELAHAFVADRSANRAPRDIHEGLAQRVEGRTAEGLLGPDGMRALAEGRLGGPRGFYAASLAFVEYLIAQRGQGGMNEVLLAMATSAPDEAFRRVYGKDLDSLRRDWLARLRQQHAR